MFGSILLISLKHRNWDKCLNGPLISLSLALMPLLGCIKSKDQQDGKTLALETSPFAGMGVTVSTQGLLRGFTLIDNALNSKTLSRKVESYIKKNLAKANDIRLEDIHVPFNKQLNDPKDPATPEEILAKGIEFVDIEGKIRALNLSKIKVSPKPSSLLVETNKVHFVPLLDMVIELEQSGEFYIDIDKLNARFAKEKSWIAWIFSSEKGHRLEGLTIKIKGEETPEDALPTGRMSFRFHVIFHNERGIEFIFDEASFKSNVTNLALDFEGNTRFVPLSEATSYFSLQPIYTWLLNKILDKSTYAHRAAKALIKWYEKTILASIEETLKEKLMTQLQDAVVSANKKLADFSIAIPPKDKLLEDGTLFGEYLSPLAPKGLPIKIKHVSRYLTTFGVGIDETPVFDDAIIPYFEKILKEPTGSGVKIGPFPEMKHDFALYAGRTTINRALLSANWNTVINKMLAKKNSSEVTVTFQQVPQIKMVHNQSNYPKPSLEMAFNLKGRFSQLTRQKLNDESPILPSAIPFSSLFTKGIIGTAANYLHKFIPDPLLDLNVTIKLKKLKLKLKNGVFFRQGIPKVMPLDLQNDLEITVTRASNLQGDVGFTSSILSGLANTLKNVIGAAFKNNDLSLSPIIEAIIPITRFFDSYSIECVDKTGNLIVLGRFNEKTIDSLMSDMLQSADTP